MNSLLYQFDYAAAERLPPRIRFGTSSWIYPGWKKLIYHLDYSSEKKFRAECLREYAATPLFRTVGVDAFFYTPPRPKQLADFCALVPPAFQFVSKVWERVTIPRYPGHARYGKWAGKDNPDFLSADLFINQVLPPYLDAAARPHTGPFVFQFPALAKEPRAHFLESLHTFLKKLPPDFRYAVEIRNEELLSREYFELLNDSGATHCFNHWAHMPPLKVQMKAAADAGGLSAPFFVARILTPLGVSYEDAVKLFQPYTEIKRPNPAMRSDVQRLVGRALERDADTYVIINNRCEGNGPMTIDSIIRELSSAEGLRA